MTTRRTACPIDAPRPRGAAACWRCSARSWTTPGAGSGGSPVSPRPAGGRAVLGDPGREPDRDHAEDDQHERHDVDDRQLGRALDRAQDPHRDRLGAGARGEVRDDDLVERQREREQPAGQQRRAHARQGHPAEGHERIRAEVRRRLLRRARQPAQAGDHVVEGDDDAEGGVADDDREQAERDLERHERRPQRDAGHDARAARSAGRTGTRSSGGRRTSTAGRRAPRACRGRARGRSRRSPR